MMDDRRYDVLVAGAGCGGICAALQAARQGASVLLVEREREIGGTGVHSPAVLICKFQRRDTHEPINTGLHKELFGHAYAWRGEFDDHDLLPTYDPRVLARGYRRLLAAEDNVSVITSCGVVGVDLERDAGGQRITAARLADGSRVEPRVAIDGTADGNLAAFAGADYWFGRDSDGQPQGATLTFGVSGFGRDMLRRPDINTWGGHYSLNRELNEVLEDARAAGVAPEGHFGVGCFAYPDGRTLLFNANHVYGIDPRKPETVAAGYAEAVKLVQHSFSTIRRHPAFVDARLAFVSKRLGVREGRRIVGDYVITGEDCLGEARFDDAVAAGAYDIDIHDPDGGPSQMRRIPNTQYYHIPYRSLRAAGFTNLLLGSRCISGDFVAHSSYRVMSTITAIGQAVGSAAALAAQLYDGDVRAVDAAGIRYELDRLGQWTEGARISPGPRRAERDTASMLGAGGSRR
jgi:hypothetical protein